MVWRQMPDRIVQFLAVGHAGEGEAVPSEMHATLDMGHIGDDAVEDVAQKDDRLQMLRAQEQGQFVASGIMALHDRTGPLCKGQHPRVEVFAISIGGMERQD